MAPAMTMSRHDDFIDDLPLFPKFQLLKPTARCQLSWTVSPPECGGLNVPG
jgi:hypothetical protein